MKNKKLMFILIGVFAVLFISASIFFVLQGLSAADKEQEYFDFYRDKAEEYIKSDSEMLNEYGNDISVEFDNSVTYRESGKRGFFDRYIEVFVPSVPATLEEFTSEMEMIKFNVKINGDLYEITFEKTDNGELVVTGLVRSK